MATSLEEFARIEARWEAQGRRMCSHGVMSRVAGDAIPARLGCLECGEVFPYGEDIERRGTMG